jgi:hypothetical protein
VKFFRRFAEKVHNIGYLMFQPRNRLKALEPCGGR